jgi:putative transposase
MVETRRKFDQDFQQGAVRLVLETGRPIGQVARDLGVNAGTLGIWVGRERRAHERGDGRPEDERADLVRLRRESWSFGWRWAGSTHIVTQRLEHAVPYATSCRALGVSPAWFYKWRDGDVSVRRARRRALIELVRALFVKHRGTYGSPRITDALRELGWAVSEKTVARLMAEAGLVARPKRRRRNLTRSGNGRWRAPDLVGRKFSADWVRQRWFGDGTEIPTGEVSRAEAPLYLSSVVDIRSRSVVRFALSDHDDADWAYGALAMAVAVRSGDVTGVVPHSDGGGEYVATSFRAACRRMGITQPLEVVLIDPGRHCPWAAAGARTLLCLLAARRFRWLVRLVPDVRNRLRAPFRLDAVRLAVAVGPVFHRAERGGP